MESLEQRTLLSVSIWDDSATPTVTAFNDPASVEVGVRFRSDTDGFVTGFRFYKGAGNTGTHTGQLWATNGSLLGSATFTQESASGWQQVSLASPVHITAGTTYVASYFAPNGHYALDSGYFAASGVDHSPLHALRDGTDGGNGLFDYTAAPVFPGSTFNSNNYWVDVTFDQTLVPQVENVAPADGALNVDVGGNVAVTFTVPMDATSITTSTVQLRDSSNAPVSAAVTYDPATRTATIDPTGTLNLNRTYKVVVKSGAAGVHSTGGNLLAADFNSTFRTWATPPISIWNDSVTPTNTSFNDSQSVEVGVRFRADVDGSILALRFYKGAGNTGTHVGSLWTTDGTLIGRATFTDETASGWQQVKLDTPVDITAGTTYIVSYFAPNGHYALDGGYFAAGGADNGPLHALQDGVDGGNGLFHYSPVPTFPGDTFNSTNYWVDVVYQQAPALEPNTPPVADAQTVNVNEDAKATIGLTAHDNETAAASLLFKILTLPQRGVLKYNGVPVTVGQTFVGAPLGLTYEPAAETEGGTTDSFTFNVSDGGDGSGDPSTVLTSDPATVSINVNKAVADGTAVLGADGVLRIGGTPGIDVITVSRQSTGKFLVTLGLKVLSSTIPVSSVSEIRVWGRAGIDGIVLIDVNQRSMLSGGDGTDVIVGSNGDDVILGGAGDDILTGFGGNDVIVGGDGRDILAGMDGNDILVAGSASPGLSAADLRALGVLWSANKVVTPQEQNEVDDVVTDDDVDLLTGGNGSDWFIISLGDKVLDYSTKVGSKDTITYV
ncbi:MAG TPA: DUF4082 domain-containing protein [Tepidisphaeraceae bacterium]